MTSDAEHDKRHSDHMSEDGDSDAPKQPKFQLDASSKAQMDGARRDVVAQNVKDTLGRWCRGDGA